MNSPKDYLKSLLIQEDCENAMDSIMDRYFEDQNNNGKSDVIETGQYYIIDPFPFLLFNKDGTISTKISIYCESALKDYNAKKDQYSSIGFLPPYIKDTYQNTIFTTITRAYIRSRPSEDIARMKAESLLEFYKLLDKVDSSKDEYVYTKFNSWYALKNAIEGSSHNRIVVPSDMVNGNSYSSFRNDKGNVVEIKVSIDYDSSIVPAMDAVVRAAEDFSHKKEQYNTKKANTSISEVDKYLSYLISYVSLNVEAAKEDSNNVKSKNASRSNAEKLKASSRNLDLAQYKNNRLDPQDNTIEYWKDSMAGDAFKSVDDNLSNTINKDLWEKVKKDLNHTLNRKNVDDDLEKVYNLKHFIPDVLGLEPSESRYDARTYEDPTRRKVKGVSGYDIFKNVKRIDKLDKENDKLRDKIALESDEDKIKKLQKQIDDNNDEIDIIKQSMKNGSSNDNDLRLTKKYKNKVDKISTENNVVTDKSMIQASEFIKENNAVVLTVRKYLENK